MGTVTGKDYLARINSMNNHIWIDGEQVQGNLSDHPAFHGILKTKAGLYDFVKENPKHLMDESQQFNFSYEIPFTHEHLKKRKKAIRSWASISAGVLGRSPDYVNSAIMAMAGYAGFFGEYADHMKDMYLEAKEQDFSFTHTFINPQVSRKFYWPDGDDETVIAAKVVKESADGLVIRGARMLATQGGLTDQLLVLPAGNFTDKSYLFGFCIPSNSPGLSFVNRPSYSVNTSSFDDPLASRFDEGDAMVVFNDVLVPWDRVFLYGDSDVAADLKAGTGLESFLLYQSSNRQVVKTEWMFGIAQLMAESLGVTEYQHIQEKLSELAMNIEIMNGLILSSEETAKINKEGVLVPDGMKLKMAYHYYQKTYPRLAEIITLLGASGLICLPSEKDFASKIEPVLSHTLLGVNLTAKDKVKLNRLAWDLTMSSFGSRQTLYERMFFGDPARTPVAVFSMYEKEQSKKQVLDFLSIDLI